MKNICLTLLFVVLTALSGCASNSAPSPAPNAAQQENRHDWSVTLSVSGGIAGLNRQLTITSNGEWMASDRRLGHKNGRVTTEQLAKLTKTVKTLEIRHNEKNKATLPGRCADCIETRVSVIIDGKRYVARTQSGSKLAPPYADVQTQLSPLLQAAFSKQ